MKTKRFYKCQVCKETKETKRDGGTGFASTRDNHHVCYDCCAKIDRKKLINLKPKEKYYLYFSNGIVTNWPETLKINPVKVWSGRHNICGKVTYVYFWLNGLSFIGKQLGNYNEILHVRKIK